MEEIFVKPMDLDGDRSWIDYAIETPDPITINLTGIKMEAHLYDVRKIKHERSKDGLKTIIKRDGVDITKDFNLLTIIWRFIKAWFFPSRVPYPATMMTFLRLRLDTESSVTPRLNLLVASQMVFDSNEIRFRHFKDVTDEWRGSQDRNLGGSYSIPREIYTFLGQRDPHMVRYIGKRRKEWIICIS